jgi:UDP-3-O-[3-hydroxymyristoyl] glucosamine N-acyltransferase
MKQSQTIKTMPLGELAERIGARLIGDAAVTITGVNTIRDAGPSEVSFLASQKLAKEIAATRAGAVIVAAPLESCPAAQLVVDNVNRALIAALQLYAPTLSGFAGIHPTATVDPEAVIDPTAAIGPCAVIARGVSVGAGTVIGPGCWVGENSTIGAHCRLDSHVAVYHHCQIGDGCIIQANTTIGATGFGYTYIDGQHRLIPHNGGVVIEDGVEIGSNCCVDRAKFGNTRIGAGTKIDNLVQIGHNVHIGKQCLFAGQSGVGGSTQIGNGVIFAGMAGIIDNRVVGDGAVVCAKTAATKDIPAGQAVMGMPPQELQRELRCASVYQRLPELAKEIKELTQKVTKLESAKND